MTTLITPHFTIEDFTYSDTAVRNGIDNTIPFELIANVKATAELLERVRSFLSSQAGKEIPVNITSGYRCPALNQAIGSKMTSDHILGRAADWQAPTYGTPFNVTGILAPMVDALGIGQLIYEFNSWVHISTAKPSNPINRVITINSSGTHVGVVK